MNPTEVEISGVLQKQNVFEASKICIVSGLFSGQYVVINYAGLDEFGKFYTCK